VVRLWHLLVLLVSLIASQLAGCGDTSLPKFELSGSTMGTTFNIVLVAPADEIDGDALQADISAELAHVNALASTWLEDSQLAAFNASQSTDWIDVSFEFCQIVEQALEVCRLSNGAFDITVGPLVNLWGFGPDREVWQPPADQLIEATMAVVGYDGLETNCSEPAMRKRNAAMYVDLSGWAKGFAVDRLAILLDEYALTDYLVEIGGEIRVRGHNADEEDWAIAVEAPSTTARRPHSVLRLSDVSVATSGDYRNYFDHDGQHYSHTIDARTGRPVDHDLAAVTVVDASAAFADAMATALLVLGPEAGPALAEKRGIAGYFLVRNETGIREITTSEFDRLRIL
jgi:thiamine biosynthesis lipoprotein